MTTPDWAALTPKGCGDSATSKRVGPPVAGVVEREVAGCFVLLSPDEERALVLNETASDVWRLLSGDLTLDKIVRLPARAYRKEPLDIYRDVELTVTCLRRHGLLDY